MLVLHKQIGCQHVMETGGAGAFAPVVFFPIAFAEGGVEKADLLHHAAANRHAKAHGGRDRRRGQVFQAGEDGIDGIERHAGGQFVVDKKFRKTANRPGVGKGRDAGHRSIGEHRRKQAFQPVWRHLRVGIEQHEIVLHLLHQPVDRADKTEVLRIFQQHDFLHVLQRAQPLALLLQKGLDGFIRTGVVTHQQAKRRGARARKAVEKLRQVFHAVIDGNQHIHRGRQRRRRGRGRRPQFRRSAGRERGQQRHIAAGSGSQHLARGAQPPVREVVQQIPLLCAGHRPQRAPRAQPLPRIQAECSQRRGDAPGMRVEQFLNAGFQRADVLIALLHALPFVLQRAAQFAEEVLQLVFAFQCAAQFLGFLLCFLRLCQQLQPFVLQGAHQAPALDDGVQGVGAVQGAPFFQHGALGQVGSLSVALQGVAAVLGDAVDGGDGFAIDKIPEAGELQPEIPVFAQVKGRVKARACQHGLAAKEHGMNGKAVFQIQIRAVKRAAIGAQHMAVGRLRAGAGIGGDGLRMRAQGFDQRFKMAGQQFVVIIQKTEQIATRCFQPGVGSLRAAQGRAGAHQPHGMFARLRRHFRVCRAAGGDNHDFQIRPRLACHGIQRIRQRRAVHAADEHGNQGRAVGRQGKIHGKTLWAK